MFFEVPSNLKFSPKNILSKDKYVQDDFLNVNNSYQNNITYINLKGKLNLNFLFKTDYFLAGYCSKVINLHNESIILLKSPVIIISINYSLLFKNNHLIIGVHSRDWGEGTFCQWECFQCRTMSAEMLVDVVEGVDLVAGEEQPPEVVVPEVAVRVRQRVVAQVKVLQVRHGRCQLKEK